jgi:hypothetical protein
MLWAIHEADIGDYFESHEVDGKVIDRPKRLADLPSEIRKNIERIAMLRLAGPWQQPAHYHLTRVVAAARKLVALRRLYSKAGGLLLGLSLIVWERHPLPNDRSANLFVCSFSPSFQRRPGAYSAKRLRQAPLS